MLALAIDPSLIWSAGAVFQYPEEEIWPAYQKQIWLLLDWGIQAGIPGAGEVKKQLITGDINIFQMQVDYTGLFINSFPGIKVHPFAGWYLGDECMFGSVEEKLRGLYFHYGILMDENNMVPADSITVEMEFLGIVAEELAQGNENCSTALAEMMNHLEDWVFNFLNDMQQNAETLYYKTLASIVSGFLLRLSKDIKGVA